MVSVEVETVTAVDKAAEALHVAIEVAIEVAMVEVDMVIANVGMKESLLQEEMIEEVVIILAVGEEVVLVGT